MTEVMTEARCKCNAMRQVSRSGSVSYFVSQTLKPRFLSFYPHMKGYQECYHTLMQAIAILILLIIRRVMMKIIPVITAAVIAIHFQVCWSRASGLP